MSFIFVYQIGFSQSHFMPGYYVNKSNDTIAGEMFLSFNNGKSILEFKDIMDRDIVQITPQEVKKVVFNNGENYTVFPFSETVYGFFRCVISGEISFYTWTDNNLQDHYFIKKENSEIKKLRREIKLVEDESKNIKYNKTINHYYRDLSIAFLDCPEIIAKLDRYTYSSKGLATAIKDYYACSNKSYHEYKILKKKKPGLRLGAYVGANYFFNIENEYWEYTPGYNVGAYIQYYIPKSRRTAYIQIGGCLSSISTEYKPTNEKPIIYSQHIPIMFKKAFRINKLQWYAGAGAFINIKGPLDHNLNLSTGVNFNRFFFEISYLKLNKKSFSSFNIGVTI